MSQKRDLLKSMTWRITRAIKHRHIQRSAMETVEVARSANDKLSNLFQGILNVRRRKG